ncbi:hypothetical protein [Bordetella holmesii]|uniref:Uncharacterized protein n=2 Tax=Bordetella holmesii TaxID=35814 RepID=A0A158M9E2_9BORD|nr:hypothetical protein [Bordetella holmesii]AHV93381.1 transcriptional regulator, AraC family domain protein [Bordetella holmesii ATCC 51541]AIT26205.1 transcriptional regulator, AraC family domain protein [Bordetella holmesii 44057]EWM44362.1 transcriptional regulator, AraC family domain protein [Bordetella holmesii 41130]EWM46775.1 transcriptional regulator, AraC family domain protein [Bordetella holmesii 35009]EWM50943.1 transcriptional regulator, AraC family domain protein [Bordetella hol
MNQPLTRPKQESALPAKNLIARANCSDVVEQADALPFWQQDYTQLSAGSFRGSVDSVSMPNLQVFRESMNRAVDEQAYAPQGT